ncbi:hypothetical protein LDENG_00065880 [Lucifuga dentata]|nr:hypothetical protein LDENG_00065880 [Lucifuga dentata]
MIEIHRGGCFVLFLAAIILALNLHTDGSSVHPASASEHLSEGLIYRPSLQPSEDVPLTGTYTLIAPAGKPCIKATMGVEYIAIEKKNKSWYFSLDPIMVSISGYCGNEAAVLSLTLPNNASSLQFTFTKEENIYYVTKLSAHIFPLPVCHGCDSKTYSGVLTTDKLFEAANGQSFKCNSENVFVLSDELQVKLIPLQIQAFTVPKGQYGEEVECWADFNKQLIPTILGAAVVGLILISVLTYLIIKDHRR